MIKQYIENGYLITEYESGAIVKVLQSQEPKEAIKELPKNPLLELKEENKELKKKLEEQKSMSEKAIVELTNLIMATKIQ